MGNGGCTTADRFGGEDCDGGVDSCKVEFGSC